MKTWVRASLLACLLAAGAGLQAQTATDKEWEEYKKYNFPTNPDVLKSEAERGGARAQYSLGEIYTKGRGVPREDQEAARWYRRAAEQGHANAQYKLGEMYDEGRGVPKDQQEAIRWLRLAAEQRISMAQFNLAWMYADGRGVPKDEREAVRWFRGAAEQGHTNAQFNLGVMYGNGRGVPRDDQEAVRWYRLAAEQGNAGAQFNLGLMYDNGEGVPKDGQFAYYWWLLASAKGNQDATTNRKIIEREITPNQRSAAQTAARNWRPKSAEQARASIGSDTTAQSPSKAPATDASAGPEITGSGFRVARNAVVTNHHVIDGCSRIRVNGVVAQLNGSDERSDLALLGSTAAGPSASLRAQRAAVGEPVAVAGYPLRGLLSGFNMTTGNLSSLSGVGGDTRMLQITAPVQPGNSGGPMLDSAGNLMGVVVSKLDAVKTAKITGDIPQNVNFAINANVLRSFLEAHGVEYETASSDKALPPTAIANKAKGFTVLVECWK